MQMMKRKKLMATTLMVLLAVVGLGGFLPVNPGNTLVITGGEAWASSPAPGGALERARASAVARWVLARVLPPGGGVGGGCWPGARERARASAVARWVLALALLPGAPPGLPWLPQEVMCGETPASRVAPDCAPAAALRGYVSLGAGVPGPRGAAAPRGP